MHPGQPTSRFGQAGIFALLIALVVTSLPALVGCAATPNPILVRPPPEGATVLVVGDIAADDPEARRWARHLRATLLDQLVRAAAFSVVYDRDQPHIDGPVLTLTGDVIEADRGSDAWRFVLGSGAGRPRLTAAFDVTDGSGAVLAAFAVESDDLGPGGLSGHWSPLSMDDLARDLGRSAAAALVRWRGGERIAAAPWF